MNAFPLAVTTRAPWLSMCLLLLIHVPGAVAHAFGSGILMNTELVETGMRFATVGAVCFVIGVWLARRSREPISLRPEVNRPDFWWACLIAGWVFTFALSPLYRIPSISAAIDKAGAVWMLGVLLGLRAAFRETDIKRIAIWVAALLVYPIEVLMLFGFLSYGSWAMIIACSVLAISVRSRLRLTVGMVAVVFVGLSVFVNYFVHRDDIRRQVWGGQPLQARIDSVVETAEDFQWLDFGNPKHLMALDARLNQNYFVGLAAERIEQGQVQYLYGRSLWEGLLSLVPRVFWPEKPVYAGSPKIVTEMTGLWLSQTTSFGVGNVMEFQINFGYPGVVVGFIALGWVIGKLDLKAAIAENQGDFGELMLFFLPCVAMIDPQGSLVQLFSGAAAALVAAYGWKWLWREWVKHRLEANAKFVQRQSQFAFIRRRV